MHKPMYRLFAFVALLGLTAGLASSAQAVQAQTPIDGEPRIQHMATIAVQVFPSVSTCGQVTILEGDLSRGGLAGEAWPPCLVRLHPSWRELTWGELCLVVVHEYGHLAGFEHVDDPHNVMSVHSLPAAVPACHRLFRLERRLDDLVFAVADLRLRRSNYRGGARRQIDRKIRTLRVKLQTVRGALGA